MLVIVSVVVQQGLGSLRQARLSGGSKQALFAAEAGAADAFRHLIEDQSWQGPLDSTTMEGGAVYSAVVVNNIAGDTPKIAPDGAKVLPGFAYVLATGSPNEEGVTRSVGVLVGVGSSNALSFALGAGGEIAMQGSKDIFGSLKANGNIALQGSTSIQPLDGSGRLLSSSDLSVQGSTSMDEAQDARARGSISGNIGGAYLVQPNDDSESTLPFINDGRTTNSLNSGEQGQVLPNPDRSHLTSVMVSHTETLIAGDFDTGGQVHYFPDGIQFGGNVMGGGTIFVDNGKSIEFQGSTSVQANLVAMGDFGGTSGGGGCGHHGGATGGGGDVIVFQGSSTVKGLVFAHEGIRFQGSSDIEVIVISYRGDIRTQGSTSIKLDSSVLANTPGFDAWASGFGGSGGIAAGSGAITVLSWERQ